MRPLIAISLLLIVCTSQAQLKNSTLYFDYATTDLIEDSKKQLDALIAELKQASANKILVKGFTDKMGTTEYNDKLSMDRAILIKTLLQAALPPDCEIKTESFGARKLLTLSEEQQQVNRRVEVSIISKREKPDVALEPFKEDVEEQSFQINLDDTVKICAKEGTCINIPPGGIQNKKGLTMKGKARLLIKEYYEPSAILLAGLHTASGDEILQTGGMFFLTIIQGTDTMDQRTKKPVEIRMPVIDRSLKSMSVFTMGGLQDTARTNTRDTTRGISTTWRNSGTQFTQTGSSWSWPDSSLLEDVSFDDDIVYTNMKVGRTYSDEYVTKNPIITFDKDKRHYAKKVEVQFTKVDAKTLKVHAKIRYRAKGRRTFDIRQLDTTFMVYYTAAENIAITNTLNWINCDRFYQGGDRIEFAMKTPGYSKMNVMVYFKSINAYMAASGSGSSYAVSKVPAHLDVELIAIGKKEGQFYFGKVGSRTQRNDAVKIPIQKVSEEDFRKAMAGLN